jgi:multiple sugar transport system substrate-binding protein
MNPTFNDELGVEALQMHKDLMQIAPPGAEAHNFDEPLAAFRGGTVANMFQWGSVYYGSAVDPSTTTLTPDQVVVMTMPAGTEGPSSHRGVWSGSINKNSAHAEAAWALLQWMSSKDGEHWSANNLGVFPARQSTLSSTPDSGNEWLVPVFKAIADGFAAAGEQEGWRPRDPQSNAIQEILADVTSQAITGELTAQEALDKGADQVRELLGK